MCSSVHASVSQPALKPERNQCRGDAGKEDSPPAKTWHDQGYYPGTQSESNGPRTLHQCQSSSTTSAGPCLRHERRSGRPLPAHAQAEDHSAHHQLPCGMRQPARARGQGVDQDAASERADAAKTVGKPAKPKAADGRRN